MTNLRSTILHTLLGLALLLALPAVAAAQATGAPAAPTELHMSPQQQVCIDEIKNDANFKAYIEDRVRYAFHRDESDAAVRNNKHVVMAYAAIWILTVLFVVLVFLRQGKLKQELERLQAELARAAKDEP